MDTISDIKPNQKKALFLAKKQLPEFVCDAVNLEGINFTLPEVQTLLDGVTVGGHRLSDQRITLNQAHAWHLLFSMIAEGRFTLSKDTACQLHQIAGEEEALEWGAFRHGGVTIAGTEYQPPPADLLDTHWNQLCDKAHKIVDIYDQAIYVFLEMARCQFFYDVNKRMGRFMMNGILLNAGYPAINLPAKKQMEFNQLMLEFYTSGDTTKMTAFMRDCLDPKLIIIMCE